MKLITLIFLFLPLCIFSQAELLFESVLYIEDAKGNRDSVEFGYALDEEKNVFNPELGEVEIFTPFDSILDMRGFTLGNYAGSLSNGMSKRVITHVNENSYDEDEGCYIIQGNLIFMIHAVNLPVTLTWNHNDFTSARCRIAATFTSHLAGATVEGWYLEPWLVEETMCASTNNSFTTFLPELGGFEVERDVDIEGGTVKNIGGVALAYAVASSLPTWCSIDSSLTTTTREVYTKPEISVYPNPALDILYLDIDFDEPFLIVDLLGQVWMKGEGRSIDVSSLSSGVYFVKMKNRKGSKFVKY